MLKNFFKKILGLDKIDLRIRRLERAKAAKGYAAGYIGKSIKGNYGGVELSNPSYVKYYGRKFMP